MGAVGLVSLYRAALPHSCDRNVTRFLQNSEVEGREVRSIAQHPQTLSFCCPNALIPFLSGTVKVKSSNIQVGDLIIVEKVSLYVYLFFVKYSFCKTIENEIF